MSAVSRIELVATGSKRPEVTPRSVFWKMLLRYALPHWHSRQAPDRSPLIIRGNGHMAAIAATSGGGPESDDTCPYL